MNRLQLKHMTIGILTTMCLASAVAAYAEDEAPSLAWALSKPVSAEFTSGAQTGDATPEGLRTPESYLGKYRFIRAAAEVVAANEVIWLFNRYIREGGTNPVFRKSWKSFHENLKAGWEWDDNNFATNQFLHPYQGALYFNAARANGYDFYQSIPFAFAGSWYWEYLAETHHPSINDWIQTAYGGIILGEALHRLAIMITDNTARGSGRGWREFGGLVVNPVRGVNRLITGEAFEVHQNPENRFPSYLRANVRFGTRTLGDENLWGLNSTKMFVMFDADYGDPMEDDLSVPFSHFELAMQHNFKDSPYNFARIDGAGSLYGGVVSDSEHSRHVIAAYQHFDYVDNTAYTFGGQSIGASYLSRFLTKTGFETRSEMHFNFIIMGANRSDHESISGRSYDYGPGLSYKLRAHFGRGGREIILIGHEQYWIHAVNGNRADHYSSITQIKVNIPIKQWLGAGVDYILYLRDSNYEDFDDVHRRAPELKLYFSWNVD